ncbi:hypothetical protein SK128_010014 [Halocaridina rubra]|uniref:C2H2-type domain-containing protein n=1 Tax=Halocaridina rubra TaxID=373956 RepID=A0AAN8X9A5_HALRR
MENNTEEYCANPQELLEVHFLEPSDESINIKKEEVPSSFNSDEESDKNANLENFDANLEDSETKKEKLFECNFCDKKYNRKVHLDRHYEVDHVGIRYSCNICTKSYTRKHRLITHLLVHHNIRKLHECKVCKQSFAAKDELISHSLLHTGHKTYTADKPNSHPCKICNKSFTRKKDLEKHELVHSEAKEYKCTVCGKTFLDQRNLNRHALTHNVDKPYECDVCHKLFSRTDLLKRHSLTHIVRKTSKCRLCSAPLKAKRDFNFLNISEQGLYACTICKKLFTRKDKLERHSSIHTVDKLHVCDMCNMSFALRNDFLKHSYSHSGKIFYECSFCLKLFTKKGTFKRHSTILCTKKHQMCKPCLRRVTKDASLLENLDSLSQEVPSAPDALQTSIPDLSYLYASNCGEPSAEENLSKSADLMRERDYQVPVHLEEKVKKSSKLQNRKNQGSVRGEENLSTFSELRKVRKYQASEHSDKNLSIPSELQDKNHDISEHNEENISNSSELRVSEHSEESLSKFVEFDKERKYHSSKHTESDRNNSSNTGSMFETVYLVDEVQIKQEQSEEALNGDHDVEFEDMNYEKTSETVEEEHTHDVNE